VVVRTLSRRTFLGRQLAWAACWRLLLLPAMLLRDEAGDRSLSIGHSDGEVYRKSQEKKRCVVFLGRVAKDARLS
jgi:hypothetical protein